jgi:signal transduction histidine kinase
MDLRLVIHRGLAYTIFTAVLSLVIIVLARIGLAPESTAGINLDVLIVVLVTLVTLSVPTQPLISRVIDPYLFRGRIDYSIALRAATHRLSRLMPPLELARELQNILTEVFVPESFGMVAGPLASGALEELSGNSHITYELVAAASVTTTPFSPSVVLVTPMSEEGLRRSAHEALRHAGIEVVITLGRRGEMLGAILLGARRSGDAYFKNDIAFMESLAEIASIALENSLLYRQRIHILEYSDRLLESLDSAVVAVDVSGRITSFNIAAKQLLDVQETAKGSPLEVLPSEIAWALALAISGAWRPREIEVSIDHTTRGQLPVICSTAVLHDDNKISGALVVVTDLSTVKALEENQRRIEHFTTMARFYAGIAHEIRSPLAAISNFVSMLADRFDDAEYRETAARLLPMEVGRIVRLADRLRLMAPSEDGKLTEVSLSPLIRDIVAIHAPSAEEVGVQLRLACPDNLPSVLGDSNQLIQLFVNLMKNAIESMPLGGTVTISAAHVRERPDGPVVMVRILDEGSGIDPSIRTRLFQPFVTTKASGTGLGLSICREIADFHRARLSLSSRPDGRGTIAQVDFPCLDDRARRQSMLVGLARSGS